MESPLKTSPADSPPDGDLLLAEPPAEQVWSTTAEASPGGAFTSRVLVADFSYGRASARLTPRTAVLALIGLSAVLRLAYAAALPLTIDEQYMVAAGRQLQLGYFDHPPAAWWLAWAARVLAGSQSAIVVRLPFILLFGLATWLMYRLAARLFSERAGAYAAALMNLSPILGVATASWVGPDGPLICALLAAALCLTHALFGDPAGARRWWIGAGISAGLALFSKYTACLTILGAAGYLLTQPAHRRWLGKPEPYLAAALAALIFAPVAVWNAEHGWASFAFQGGRAAAQHRWGLTGPLEVLAGGALFNLPHLWLALIAALVVAARRGAEDAKAWLLVWLAVPTLTLFVTVALWNSQVMFHWSSPGYLMAMPLAGAMLAGLSPSRRLPVRRVLAWTGVFLVIGCAAYAAETQWNLAPAPLQAFLARFDPNVESGDWSSLADALQTRGLLDRPGLFIGAADWSAAGKLDYALQGKARIVGVGSDMREYGELAAAAPRPGADALIPIIGNPPAIPAADLARRFASLDILPPVSIVHGGHVVQEAALLLGRRYRGGPA